MVIYNVTHAHVIRKARKFSPPIKVCYFSIYQVRIKKHNTKHLKIYIFLIPEDHVPSRRAENRGGLLGVQRLCRNRCHWNSWRYFTMYLKLPISTYWFFSSHLSLHISFDSTTFSFRYVPFALFQIQKLLLLYKERRRFRGWSLCE